jgi:hypothetical protein
VGKQLYHLPDKGGGQKSIAHMPYDQRLKDQVIGHKKKYRNNIKAGKPE